MRDVFGAAPQLELFPPEDPHVLARRAEHARLASAEAGQQVPPQKSMTEVFQEQST
jgi:hypothetical protein